MALFLAALWAAWRGLADDLVDLRRTQRLMLVAICAGFGVLVASGAVAIRIHDPAMTGPWPIQTLVAGGCLAVAWFYCVATLRPHMIAAKPPLVDLAPLAATIGAAMARDKLHRQPDLTVAALAARLRTPEHKVRAAINAQLGFANFSAFVNSYRLAEVTAALSDPDQAATPISTIALDAAFGSIPSFNRVFKAAKGMARSAFRKEHGP